MRYLLGSIGVVICTIGATFNLIQNNYVWFWLLAAFAVIDLIMLLDIKNKE